MTEEPTNLLEGTLDLVILKALAEIDGPEISRRIDQITLNVDPGSLFPALHKMEEAGWLTSSRGESENSREAKYYRLTKAERRQLETEAQRGGRAIARAREAS